jgi:hypothetical protein
MHIFCVVWPFQGKKKRRHHSSNGHGRSMHENLGGFQCPLGYMIFPQHPHQFIDTPSPKYMKKRHQDDMRTRWREERPKNKKRLKKNKGEARGKNP